MRWLGEWLAAAGLGVAVALFVLVWLMGLDARPLPILPRTPGLRPTEMPRPDLKPAETPCLPARRPDRIVYERLLGPSAAFEPEPAIRCGADEPPLAATAIQPLQQSSAANHSTDVGRSP